MSTHVRLPRPERATACHRRGFLVVAAGIIAGAWPLPGAARPHRAAPATPAPGLTVPPQGATYVGRVGELDALLAIVLPADAPETAVAYLCSGPDLSLWFTGQIGDDGLALTAPTPTDASPEPGRTLAEPAPSLRGRLDNDGVSGAISLPGHALSFAAIPAAGIAGLYAAERDASGVVRGQGSTGATLSAQQVAATSGEAPYQIVGTIVAADGSPQAIELPAWTNDAAAVRWIFLADGEVRGARRRRERDREDDSDDDGVIDKIIF